jgi:hypothetical protein
MTFEFASTNLVIELGIILVILMGWQFAAAETLPLADPRLRASVRQAPDSRARQREPRLPCHV